MTVDSRQKRSRLGNQRFLLSIFYTLFFYSLYLLALYYIPAPESFLGQRGEIPERKLLGSIFNYQIEINFIIYLLLIPFTTVPDLLWKKREAGKRRRLGGIQPILSKVLKPNIIAFAGVFSCWDLVKGSPYLLLLTYFSFFVSNSVFELIVGFLDDYGICKGFDLIFLTNKFPLGIIQKLFSSLFKTILFSGSHSDLERSLLLLSISAVIYSFISISNKKWEIPINTSRVSPGESYINYSPTFLLQANFDVFPLTIIPSLVKACSVLWSFLLRSLKGLRQFSFFKEFSVLWKDFDKLNINSSSFGEIFFAVNNSATPFLSFCRRGKKNISFFPAIICWVFVIHFANWLFISSSQLNPREISEELERSGAYLDSTHPGGETRKLIGRAVNNLVAQWALWLTLFAVFFDNIIFNLMNRTGVSLELIHQNQYSSRPLFSLLMTVSKVVDISKQVRKHYNGSKFYD